MKQIYFLESRPRQAGDHQHSTQPDQNAIHQSTPVVEAIALNFSRTP
jgi:hypothetical protein